MRNYLQNFLNDFDYPLEAKGDLLNCYDSLTSNLSDKKDFEDLIKTYSLNKNCDMLSLYKRMEIISNKNNLNIFTSNLVFFICLSKKLKEYYLENNIGKDIWFNTMLDLKYKLMECKLVKNVWGSFVPTWFFGFFNLTRFAFNRLQFELIRFGHNCKIDDKKQLSNGDLCINVHIPRSGTKLDREEVVKSYKIASNFFKKDFGDNPIVFVCHSWLLYSKIRSLLSPKSNIYQFQNDYIVVEEGDDKDYAEVWRLFDMDYDGNVDNLPQDSSLRVGVANLIRNKEKFGWGLGVYFYSE